MAFNQRDFRKDKANDTKSLVGLESVNGGLYFGAGKTLDAGSFFSGLIDDVRIYNRAVIP